MKVTIPVVIVEESFFPGDVLIGYITMREEGIVVLPAARAARISGKFLPFIKPCSHTQSEATMPLVKDEDRRDLSRVAERSCLENRDKEKTKHKHNNVDEIGRAHRLNEQIIKSNQEKKTEDEQDSQ